MKRIKLNKGQFALVDNDMFNYLNQWHWYYSQQGRVRRNKWIKEKQVLKTVFLHHEILTCPSGFQIDHIDANPLNNQRSNLRVVTQSQNQWNSRLRSDNTSGYKGVKRSGKKWIATIQANDKEINLGTYAKIRIAWLARKWGERLYHGKFAYREKA